MIPSKTGVIVSIEQKEAEMEYDFSVLLSSHPMLTLVWFALRIWSKYL